MFNHKCHFCERPQGGDKAQVLRGGTSRRIRQCRSLCWSTEICQLIRHSNMHKHRKCHYIVFVSSRGKNGLFICDIRYWTVIRGRCAALSIYWRYSGGKRAWSHVQRQSICRRVTWYCSPHQTQQTCHFSSWVLSAGSEPVPVFAGVGSPPAQLWLSPEPPSRPGCAGLRPSSAAPLPWRGLPPPAVAVPQPPSLFVPLSESCSDWKSGWG